MRIASLAARRTLCRRTVQGATSQTMRQPSRRGEVSDPQPEAALTALSGEGETVTEVSTADDLNAAIADVNVGTVKLAAVCISHPAGS